MEGGRETGIQPQGSGCASAPPPLPPAPPPACHRQPNLPPLLHPSLPLVLPPGLRRYHKQAAEGDNTGERPMWAEKGGLDFEGRARWDAWTAVKVVGAPWRVRGLVAAVGRGPMAGPCMPARPGLGRLPAWLVPDQPSPTAARGHSRLWQCAGADPASPADLLTHTPPCRACQLRRPSSSLCAPTTSSCPRPSTLTPAPQPDVGEAAAGCWGWRQRLEAAWAASGASAGGRAAGQRELPGSHPAWLLPCLLLPCFDANDDYNNIALNLLSFVFLLAARLRRSGPVGQQVEGGIIMTRGGGVPCSVCLMYSHVLA